LILGQDNPGDKPNAVCWVSILQRGEVTGICGEVAPAIPLQTASKKKKKKKKKKNPNKKKQKTKKKKHTKKPKKKTNKPVEARHLEGRGRRNARWDGGNREGTSSKDGRDWAPLLKKSNQRRR